MNFRDLELKYGDFYVPAFAVKVRGRNLVRELFLTVPSVEVDLEEKKPARFTFTVANAFDWEARAFQGRVGEETIKLIDEFSFGSPVEIAFGYGDELVTILSGIVTELGTSFREGAVPELTVSGYDGLFPLTKGKNTQQWEGVPDSQAVRDLVRFTHLPLNVVETSGSRRRIDQSQETDMAFLTKLAERNQATFYVSSEGFYFGPRNNSGTGVVALSWGKGLLTFNPDANLADQIETVEVHGWSAERGEPIVGRATRGDETGRDNGLASGAEHLARAINNRPTMRVRAPVHTQSEADIRARGILEERAQSFVTADGESIGLPEIVPDVNIDLEDLGATFSKTYYVTSSRHKVDGSGYRTTFNVRETTL